MHPFVSPIGGTGFDWRCIHDPTPIIAERLRAISEGTLGPYANSTPCVEHLPFPTTLFNTFVAALSLRA